ncbi:MAG TPA: type III-B CRISPR module RAMP protein Cmr4 [Saprospiraceae bacterium]|nr:type III-B CRISPR module RAMP protein Cmr4 [Saprospiraceae bacterium]
MLKNSGTLFLICETPLHAGSGDALGVVDLPIQRERHTSFPKIEASSLKGALREAFEEQVVSQLKEDKSNLEDVKTLLKKLNIVFGFDDGALKHFSKEALRSLFTEKDKETGKEKEAKTDFAGAIGFTDARLLLFPVKSMKGVFAWITCLRVLTQFEKDMKMSNPDFKLIGQLTNPDADQAEEEKEVNNSCYLLNNDSDLKINKSDHIVLEEYAFKAIAPFEEFKIENKPLATWLAEKLFTEESYWHKKIQKDVVILSDDDFKDFVNLSTEVITRIGIDNLKGTVKDGALFTEEYLPAESVLYSIVLANPEFSENKGMSADQVLTFVKDNTPEVFQLGGNATLGKGIVRSKLLI